MNAEIITIGDEILIGQVLDTNSAFLGHELSKLGINVVRITSVRDNRDSILAALDGVAKNTGLVIITGGLGPTTDDITKQSLAEYFGSKLVIDHQVLARIDTWLKQRGVMMNDLNARQALLPDNCEILPNYNGTAQGMWFTRGGRSFVSLPGVPYEMENIFTGELAPRLKERFELPVIRHMTVLTTGIPESKMAMLIGKWEKSLPDNIRLAYLPSPGILKLRLTGSETAGRGSQLETEMNLRIRELELIIGKNIFGYGNERLPEVVGRLLRERALKLSVAESCTGGKLGELITSVPGSSDYFKGGLIAYSNDVKIRELGVNESIFASCGAVSREVAEQMAMGANRKFGTDLAIAITGIAGPSGGSPVKPVGTTWIAVSYEKKVVSDLYHFGELRDKNILKAAIAGLFMLRNTILDLL